MTFRADWAGLALAGVAAVCLTVCAVAGVDAPGFLGELALVALGVGGGAALPRNGSPAPAALPPSPAGTYRAPEPRPAAALDAEPATGIFSRIVP